MDQIDYFLTLTIHQRILKKDTVLRFPHKIKQNNHFQPFGIFGIKVFLSNKLA